MANSELVKTLDYILNRCNGGEIDAVAAAVVRRRTDIALFGSIPAIPDPGRMAKELSSQLNVDGAIEGLRKSGRDYAIRIIKQEAPELADEQIQQLTDAWIPDPDAGSGGIQGEKLPADLLAAMVEQFVAYSAGTMDAAEEQGLRKELGAWPERYWKAFPELIRLLITDYLKNEIDEREFRSKLDTALTMQS